MADEDHVVQKRNGKKLSYAKDNMERMPYEFYAEIFRKTEPTAISNRLGIPYDLGKQEFTVMFMGKRYRITHPEFAVSHVEGIEDLLCEPVSVCGDVVKSYYPLEEDVYAKILVLRYLLNSSVFSHNGEFRSYRELPSGDLYDRQFQGRCIFRLNRKYGNRLEMLKKVMDHLGAAPVKLGDMGYDLEIFEELYVRFILWEGDEEFPASSQVLFSSNFPAAFGAYDLAEVGEICINTFSNIEKIL